MPDCIVKDRQEFKVRVDLGRKLPENVGKFRCIQTYVITLGNNSIQ